MPTDETRDPLDLVAEGRGQEQPTITIVTTSSPVEHLRAFVDGVPGYVLADDDQETPR